MKSSMIISSFEHKDIVFAEFRSCLHLDLGTAKSIVSDWLRFSRNRIRYMIIDVANIKSLTTEARKFLQQPDALGVLGVAVVASNPLAVLIANVFIKSVKKSQARFFSTKKEAFDWIQEKLRSQRKIT